MKESITIKFLYKTFVGRILLKLLVNPTVSRASAYFLKSSFSCWLVPVFVKKNRIDMQYFDVPEGGFRSFNDFFTRKIKEKYICKSNEELVCPCDGLLTVADINADSVFNIKHTEYSVKELLKDEKMADEYQGGTAFIFRLTPAHYHRYIWTTAGTVCSQKHISGVLHSVQPVCHEKTKVFIQNSREYSVIHNPKFGKVIQMEVGALLVGKISNYEIKDQEMVSNSQEKGYFEYGGSTVVVLIKDKVLLNQDILERNKPGEEIPVIIGEGLVQEKEEREELCYGNQ